MNNRAYGQAIANQLKKIPMKGDGLVVRERQLPDGWWEYDLRPSHDLFHETAAEKRAYKEAMKMEDVLMFNYRIIPL